MFLITACKKEDEPKPDANYLGELKLEYARSFPDFTASVTIAVAVNQTGEITMADPDPVNYEGEDQASIEGDLIKQNETGTVTITGASGTYKEIAGQACLSVQTHTLINGTQTT